MKVVNKPQVYLEPGKYWIGDLCYVMDDEWSEVCDLIIDGHDVKDGGFRLMDGREFVSFSTAYGDGTYFDADGRSYSVDSGGIGAIRVEDIASFDSSNAELGNVVEFTKPFIAEYVDGVIYFGKVAIDTDPEYSDAEENYDE